MRPQQHRLSYPLTSVQVENMDSMFETLFKAINGGQITVDTSQVASGVLPMANGGTGSASLDAGGIVYSTGTTLTTDAANLFWDSTNKRAGFRLTAPTAYVHIGSGTTAANTAPLKFNSGTSMTTAEAGAVEFTTDDLFFTITTGAARKAFILDDGARLTSGRVPFATTNGRLIDDADLTFATDTLTATKIVTTSLTDSGLTSGRVTFAGTGGLLSDDADMTFSVDTLTVTKIIASSALTASALTSGRVTFASTGGLLSDDASLTFSPATLKVTQSGTGNAALELVRSGGTASDWIIYDKPSVTDLVFFSGSDKFTFSTTGTLTHATGILTDHLEIGSSVSATGAIRLPNNTVGITTRNAANTADIGVFTTDATDDVVFGFSNAADLIFKPQNTEIARFISAAGLQMITTGAYYWNGRAVLLSPANGQLNVTNNAQSTGVGFDVATDAVFKIRTRAQTGYATVDALGYKASGTAGVSFGPAAVASITVVNGIVTAIS